MHFLLNASRAQNGNEFDKEMRFFYLQKEIEKNNFGTDKYSDSKPQDQD